MLEQPLDVGHALALGLCEVVAAERLEHRAAAREIELQHPVRAAQVEVDRALVNGRERRAASTVPSTSPELASIRAKGRPTLTQRDPRSGIVVGALGNEAGRSLAQEAGIGRLLRRPLPAVAEERRVAGASAGLVGGTKKVPPVDLGAVVDRGSPPPPAAPGTRRGAGRRTGRARPRRRCRPRARGRAVRRGPTSA